MYSFKMKTMTLPAIVEHYFSLPCVYSTSYDSLDLRSLAGSLSVSLSLFSTPCPSAIVHVLFWEITLS